MSQRRIIITVLYPFSGKFNVSFFNDLLSQIDGIEFQLFDNLREFWKNLPTGDDILSIVLVATTFEAGAQSAEDVVNEIHDLDKRYHVIRIGETLVGWEGSIKVWDKAGGDGQDLISPMDMRGNFAYTFDNLPLLTNAINEEIKRDQTCQV